MDGYRAFVRLKSASLGRSQEDCLKVELRMPDPSLHCANLHVFLQVWSIS